MNITYNASDTGCSTNEEIMVDFQFYAWGIVANIIAFCGLLGNGLSIIVLSHQRMRSSTSIYLISLAAYDIIVLLSMALFLALPILYISIGVLEDYHSFYPYIHPIAYPIALIAQTGTIYTTVGFTIERYFAVCRPLHAANVCTLSRSKRAIILIFLCSIIYNIPRMFEYKTVETWNNETNITHSNYELTELGKNMVYQKVYFIYLNLIVMFLLPFTLLAFLNIQLICAIRTSKTTRRQMNALTTKENNLTVMLFSVTCVFLICQLPAIADNILWTIINPEKLNCSLTYVQFTTISNLMVVINSAINFILYCLFGKKFRQVFCKLICPRFKKPSYRYRYRPESMSLVSRMKNNSTRVYHTKGGNEIDSTSTSV